MIFDLTFIALIVVLIVLVATDRRRARPLGNVVVTTTQGDSLLGSASRGWRTYYLASVKLLNDGVEHDVSGTFEIPKRHVVMIQRLPAPAAPVPTKPRPPMNGENG